MQKGEVLADLLRSFIVEFEKTMGQQTYIRLVPEIRIKLQIEICEETSNKERKSVLKPNNQKIRKLENQINEKETSFSQINECTQLEMLKGEIKSLLIAKKGEEIKKLFHQFGIAKLSELSSTKYIDLYLSIIEIWKHKE